MKNISTSNAYFRLLSFLKPYRKEFFLALFCMVLFGATDGAVPFLVKHVLDGVFQKQDKALLYTLPLILFGFALVRALVDFGQQFLMSRVGNFIVRDVRNAVHSHVLTLPPSFFIRHSSADLVSRITNDVLLIRTLLTDTASAVLRDSIRVVALLIAAIYLDPFLALIAVVACPLGIIPVYRFGKKIRKLSRIGQEVIGSISSLLQEHALGNRVVKIFNREDFERRRFAEANERLTTTFVKAERTKALTGPVNEVLASIAISLVALYGGYSVIGGLRSQGEFIAFLLSIFLLYDPFKKLSRVHAVTQQGMAGAERIFEVLDTKSLVESPSQPLVLPRRFDIEFIDVNYSYTESRSEAADEEVGKYLALKNINLSIKEGSKVALVGFSGSGKSTLVDLIPRFIDPSSGVVKIGGVDISFLNLYDLRSRIAMVGQHTFLFHDTVFRNIAYGKEGAKLGEIEEAARAAYALEFIKAMPNGFETVIGEGGFALSGGERQRLAIARAILKNAPILILDEATASLDNRSEREVQSALEELEKGRTTIVIAHRLSTVRKADLIIVLRDGNIVESGTHEELLKYDGEFAKLYTLQFAEREGVSEETFVN